MSWHNRFFCKFALRVGLTGGYPAEKDNDGCYFLGKIRAPETITERKEFCDRAVAWRFAQNSTHGVSEGKTLPAVPEPGKREYLRAARTAEHAAAIPCRQVLSAYAVSFER